MDIVNGIIEGVKKAFENSAVPSALTVAVLFFAFFYSIRLVAKNKAKWLAVFFAAYVVITGVAFIAFELMSELKKMFFKSYLTMV